MRTPHFLQLVICAVFGLTIGFVYASGGVWVDINYSSDTKWSDCGDGYFTCSAIDHVVSTVDPYSCLERGASGVICETYAIDNVECAAGTRRQANFRMSGRVNPATCDSGNNCI